MKRGRKLQVMEKEYRQSIGYRKITIMVFMVGSTCLNQWRFVERFHCRQNLSSLSDLRNLFEKAMESSKRIGCYKRTDSSEEIIKIFTNNQCFLGMKSSMQVK